MKLTKTIYYTALLVFSFSHKAYSQIEIDTSKTADHIVRNVLLGKGVLVGNISYQGTPYSMSLFKDSEKTLGFQSGVLLTSGNAFNAVGPNISQRSGWVNGAAGDADLSTITLGKTYDAAVLEFDFITTFENLSFQYVFASEEYLEYVGSKFNDVFGFFIDGLQVNNKNIATLPDNKTVISINNINHKSNKEFFIDNTFINTRDPFVWDVRKQKVINNKMYMKKGESPKYNVQYDGFTVVLEATCKVIPNEIYHIKLAIADVSDRILDSGVFLKGGSFHSYGKIPKIITKSFERDTKPKVTALLPKREPKDSAAILIYDKLYNIEFAFDKSIVPDSSAKTIKKICQLLKKDPQAWVEISGHTDSHGSNHYNLELSEKRSKAVSRQFRGCGVDGQRIIIQYYGEDQPLKSNNTNAGRARNRRVDFRIFEKTLR